MKSTASHTSSRPERDFWRDRPVFVTGATGLLGGWTVKALVELGAAVVALVRDDVPNCLLRLEGLDRRIAAVHGDLGDPELLRRTIGEYDVRTILHLGAQTQVGVAKTDPVSTLETNVRGTWNLLEAARLSPRVESIVVASSDKAYGPPVSLPYDEDHPLRAIYPYDVSKSCADLIATMYAETFGLAVAITRCGNLFGGGDLNFNRLIPGLVRSTLKGERFVIRSDGKFIRDYLYVIDAVNGYLRLAECLTKSSEWKGKAFNLGLEVNTTVLDIFNIVSRIMHAEHMEPVILGEASLEEREQSLKADRARTLLNWTPQYSLEEGLRETVNWYIKYFDDARQEVAAGTLGGLH